MLKEVMARTPYRHKRWGERKFRYKFVLRCLINFVTTIKNTSMNYAICLSPER